jgi:glycosyltransferase involved in cell wall biosynthesis
MRIGLINDYPPSTGIGNYAYSLFSELRKLGRDVEMLYLAAKEAPAPREGMRVISTPYKLPFLRRTFNWYFYFPKKIPGGYDLYHATNQYLSRVAEHRRPCVVSCMDIFPVILKKDYPFPLRFMLEKALQSLRRADAVITISEYSKKELVSKLNMPREKIKVVYLGVDTNTFKPVDKEDARKKINLPLDKKIILHVGSEEPRKNISGLIEAFYKFKKKNPNAFLIRVGEKRASTGRLIRELGLEREVLYYERVSKENLVLLYNSSDVFALPSFYEGFGLPALEAMACGVPVIASNSPSLSEVIGDGGIMVDPFDVNALTRSMSEVLAHREIRRYLIEKGLKRAKSFSWEKTARETLDTYEKIYEKAN